MPWQTLRFPTLSGTAWLLILCLACHAAVAASWRPLAKGLEYLDMQDSGPVPWSHIYAFRFNLEEYRLSIALAKSLSRDFASVHELAARSHAVLASNGGFFDKEYRPLGLRLSNYRILSPLKHVSWWGVFFTEGSVPRIVSPRDFRKTPGVDFAIQSGPRLLVHGQIPPLRPGRAERTALGITHDRRVILLVTDNAPMTTSELAQRMRAAPLNCVDALNLDGGSSTQLSARTGTFRLSVHGFSNVSDALLVTTR